MAQKFKMTTGAPAKKVTFAAVAAAIATLLVSLIEKATGDALAGDARTAIVTIVTFLAGYYTPPAENDTVVPDQ